jgi:hypothetical protein
MCALENQKSGKKWPVNVSRGHNRQGVFPNGQEFATRAVSGLNLLLTRNRTPRRDTESFRPRAWQLAGISCRACVSTGDLETQHRGRERRNLLQENKFLYAPAMVPAAQKLQTPG